MNLKDKIFLIFIFLSGVLISYLVTSLYMRLEEAVFWNAISSIGSFLTVIVAAYVGIIRPVIEKQDLLPKLILSNDAYLHGIDNEGYGSYFIRIDNKGKTTAYNLNIRVFNPKSNLEIEPKLIWSKTSLQPYEFDGIFLCELIKLPNNNIVGRYFEKKHDTYSEGYEIKDEISLMISGDNFPAIVVTYIIKEREDYIWLQKKK